MADHAEPIDLDFLEIRIRNGLVQVEVVLRRWDDAEIENLKTFGFAEMKRTTFPRTLLGTVPVSRLGQLGEIEKVKSVVPYTYYGDAE
jgi:hypothetical protein